MKSLTEVTELDKVLRIDVDHLGVVLLVDDIDLDTEDNLLHRVRAGVERFILNLCTVVYIENVIRG